MPKPKAVERHSGGTNLPNAPTTMVKAQPDSPKPISTPADKVSAVGVVAERHQIKTGRVEQGADAQHARRAEAVGDGAGKRLADAPQQILKSPAQRRKRRGPNDWSCDSGVRKKPSEERGPKLIIPIRQPADDDHGRRAPTAGDRRCATRPLQGH